MPIIGTDQAVTRREHNLDVEAKRVQVVDAFGGAVTDGNYTQMIDVVDSGLTYIGLAQIGTATSESTWQIKKIVTSGTVTSITWAESTDEFTNEWDERASYDYA